MMPKAILVDASGHVENLDAGDAVGKCLVRRGRPCLTCGAPTPDRKFEGHYASDAKTAHGKNAGCIVFLEVPA
jgi:hypothetical protein